MAAALYLLASALTAAMAVVHLVVGGPAVGGPLFAAGDLPESVIWLLYFSWHVGTVALVVVAAALLYAARRPGNRAVAAFAAALPLGMGALGLGLALFATDSLWSTPAPYAFGAIGLIAVLGAAADIPSSAR